jgi:hypothetical protein
MPPDDYDPLQRQEDARVAAAARLAEVARKIAGEDRAQMWDQLGFNIRTDIGMERLRRVLNAIEAIGFEINDPKETQQSKRVVEWLYEAYVSSLTRNKRLLTWLTTLVGIGTGALAFIKFYIDWRHQ